MENKNVESEKKMISRNSGRKSIFIISVAIFAVAGVIVLVYLWQASKEVYVDKCQIEADSVSLSSTAGGRLNAIYVKDGDTIRANQPIVQVGNDIVRSKIVGLIIDAPTSVGANYAPNQTVATMIDPNELRLDAKVEEDKGLDSIKTGQKVMFTVDAFGGQKYYGLVSSIAPTNRASDVVFNISSAREEQDFDVKIRFDVSKYPELKNGMSGKAWIFKD